QDPDTEDFGGNLQNVYRWYFLEEDNPEWQKAENKLLGGTAVMPIPGSRTLSTDSFIWNFTNTSPITYVKCRVWAQDDDYKDPDATGSTHTWREYSEEVITIQQPNSERFRVF